MHHHKVDKRQKLNASKKSWNICG